MSPGPSFLGFLPAPVSGVFVMIIGRKEQRQACIQLLEQKTFTGTRHKKLAEKKLYISQTLNFNFTYVPEKIFCNNLDVLCFTRVENKQKNSILICPKDFGLWVKICLWPSKRLAALCLSGGKGLCFARMDVSQL